MAHSFKPRIMYIENKGGGFVEMYGQVIPEPEGGELTGPATIGRVTFNRTGKTLFYKGKSFSAQKASSQTTSASRRESVTGSRARRSEAGMLCMRQT
jgi:hypothetical protein